MKNILAVILCCFIYDVAYSQNIIIQQNNPKQTEKVVIKEKEVPVYIKKQPSAPTKPICLYGYLWVYPEDLGRFKTYPADVIAAINKSGAFGRNNWRLPTLDELRVLQQNVDKLGKVLWSNQMTSFYMHQYYGHACCCDSHIRIDGDFAYAIRLVSTDYSPE